MGKYSREGRRSNFYLFILYINIVFFLIIGNRKKSGLFVKKIHRIF